METLDQVAARWQLATVVRTKGSARTYASRLARFEVWCQMQGHCWYPADAETVRVFLEGLSEAGVQPQLAMCFVQAINAGHHALGLPPPLPMRRHATGPLGGKKLTVDKRYHRAADQMLDPGWRPAHLAALSTPTAPGNQPSTELTVNAGRLVTERANRDEEIALMLERTSLARNTHHGYRLQLASFLAWCHENDITPLPADPNAVAHYLAWYGTQAQDGRGRGPATLNQAVSAIRYAHRLQDLPSPTDHPRIKRS